MHLNKITSKTREERRTKTLSNIVSKDRHYDDDKSDCEKTTLSDKKYIGNMQRMRCQ